MVGGIRVRVRRTGIMAAGALVVSVFASHLPHTAARAQNFNAFQTYAYVFTCNGQRFERYISARNEAQAVARMSWLDTAPCRVESFVIDGGNGRNLWPRIRQELADAQRAREQAQQEQGARSR